MNIGRIRYGIETTIAGFFWITPVLLLYFCLRPSGCPASCPCARSGLIALSDYGDIFPYMAIALTAASYFAGLLADIGTQLIMQKRFEHMREVNTRRLINFQLDAPPELLNEFNSKRGRNMLLRTIGCAFLIHSIILGVIAMNKPSLISPVFPIGVACLGILILRINCLNRRKFLIYRHHLFAIVRGRRSRDLVEGIREAQTRRADNNRSDA